MENIPVLVIDLAYILVIAGAVTVLFKRLKQPLVLGYIVAGFLAGPHMPYTPSVANNEEIVQWGDIGVIFLMFTLGLEFSFKKIMRMGMQPIIATLCVMFSMFSIGSTIAYTFGWNNMDSLFLGGMLAMSSTTIIYKAYDDLGLSSKPFASRVISTLILEDILGILLMVMLSAVAVSNRLEGMQLMTSFIQLAFFLIFCFIVGIFLVPTFFRRYKKYINTETLLIISVGLCFLMVVLSSKMGYSPAFGAFMMGSILSETMESERIEHTMSSLRNLFGAIFFVSVGMLVDPQVLLDYWPAILGITAVVILGQMTLGTFSFLVSGSSLKDAMHSGFSLVQIGEFAFIIAALGDSLKVTSSFLYPIVVAVSIITTFCTPYVIRLAEPAYMRLYPLLPVFLRSDSRTDRKSPRHGHSLTPAVAWRILLTEIAVQTVVFIVLSVALSSFCISVLWLLCNKLLGDVWGDYVCAALSVLLLSPIVRPIIKRRNKNKNARYLYAKRGMHRTMYHVLITAKFILGVAIIFNLLHAILEENLWVELAASIVLAYSIVHSRPIKYMSIYIERIFTANFHYKDNQDTNHHPRYGSKLKGSDMRIASLTVPLHSLWSGKTLSNLRIGHVNAICVVAIVRGDERINIPGPQHTIYAGDVLEVAGDESAIDSFSVALRRGVKTEEEILQSQQTQLTLGTVTLTSQSPFVGKNMVALNLRAAYNCLIIGIEDEGGNVHRVSPQRPFMAADVVWLVGHPSDVERVRQQA